MAHSTATGTELLWSWGHDTYLEWLELVAHFGVHSFDDHVRPQKRVFETALWSYDDHCHVESTPCPLSLSPRFHPNWKSIVERHEQSKLSAPGDAAMTPFSALRVNGTYPTYKNYYTGESGRRAAKFVQNIFYEDFVKYGYEPDADLPK